MKAKDQEKLLEAAALMKLLSHPVRLAILCDLLYRGRMSAGEIFEAQEARASASQVSQYLSEFRRQKFVRAEKKGQNVFYTFSSPLVKSLIELLYKAYCRK